MIGCEDKLTAAQKDIRPTTYIQAGGRYCAYFCVYWLLVLRQHRV